MRDNALKPAVLGIGSCRVLTPISLLARSGRVQSLNDSIAWYTHSTRDSLQKLDIVSNRRVLSEEEVPLVVHGLHKWHPEGHSCRVIEAADVVVLEVASLKQVDFDGLELQQWCLRDYLVANGVEPGLFMKLLETPIANRGLSSIPDTVSPRLLRIAREAVAGRQTADMLMADLVELRTALGKPMVLVPHINVLGENGSLIPERALIAETLARFCAEYNETFFDPSPIVLQHGADVALIDLGHYHPAFESVIAEELFKVLQTSALT